MFDFQKDNIRKFLFQNWPGCSNGDCVVRGKTPGMHTNGSCSCVVGAGRSQLNMLGNKLKVLCQDVEKSQNSVEGIFLRVTKLASKYDTAEDLFWDKDLNVAILCNDVFVWACSDVVEIESHDDIDMLEQAWKDAGFIDGSELYCARKIGMRPQGAMYKHIDRKNWHLFDACGPERDPKEPGNTPKPTE
jgi:hypothetical protein